MTNTNKHTALRIVLAVVLLLIAGAVGFSLWVNQHYKKIIKTKLPGIVARSTDSAYTITLKDISINILTRRVTIYGIKLSPDTNQIKKLRERGKSYNTIFTIAVPQVELSGIIWEDLIADRQAYCKNLLVTNPQITINSVQNPTDSNATKATDTLNTKNDDHEPVIEKFTVETIRIVHPDITYHAVRPTDSFYCYAKGGEITLNNWALDPSLKKDTSNFLYSKNGAIKFDSLIYKKPNGLYNIKTGAVAYVSEQKLFTLKDLKISPAVSQEDFYKRVGHQKEIYHLNFPSIELTAFDWRKFMDSNQLFAHTLNISNPSLSIFFSRLYPANTESKLGKYPNQLLHKLKLKLNIDSVYLHDGHFKYTEINEDTKKAGILLFENIHGSIQNVTNIDSLVAQNHNCIIALQGKFMHTSEMSARFNLALNDTNGYFTLDGYLKNLNANQINEQAKALAKADVQSLHLERMDMHVEGNQNYGRGHFTVLYNNLKVELQQTTDNHSLKDKPVLSFLANTLFLYPDNPMQGDEVRKEDTYLKRDIHKSFFSLIWKNIFQAAEKTAVRNQKVLDAVKKDKNGKKKGIIKSLFGKKK